MLYSLISARSDDRLPKLQRHALLAQELYIVATFPQLVPMVPDPGRVSSPLQRRGGLIHRHDLRACLCQACGHRQEEWSRTGEDHAQAWQHTLAFYERLGRSHRHDTGQVPAREGQDTIVGTRCQDHLLSAQSDAACPRIQVEGDRSSGCGCCLYRPDGGTAEHLHTSMVV